MWHKFSPRPENFHLLQVWPKRKNKKTKKKTTRSGEESALFVKSWVGRKVGDAISEYKGPEAGGCLGV